MFFAEFGAGSALWSAAVKLPISFSMMKN